MATNDLADGDRLRLGIIGLGRVAERFHLPALRKSSRWQVVGTCDPRAERRELAQKSLRNIPAYFDVAELLNQVSMDAVLIATPPAEHAHLASQTLVNGQHVLVEKPFGVSRSDARSIVSTASASSRISAAGYNRRFKASYQELKRELMDGLEKTIQGVRFELGFPPRQWDPISGYLADLRAGGGVILDVTAHQFDLIPWLFQAGIERLRVTGENDANGAGHEIGFELELSNGVVCECIARHGIAYTELLEVRTDARLYLAHPTGLIAIEQPVRRLAHRLAAVRNWIDRKLIRLGLLEDELAASYHSQLEGFASYLIDGAAGEIARGEDAVRVHAALEALSHARNEIGEWARIPEYGLPSSE